MVVQMPSGASMNATVSPATANPAEANTAAELLYSSSPFIFDYVYEKVVSGAHENLKYHWLRARGILSHSLALEARSDGRLVGLAVGFTQAEKTAHLPDTIKNLAERLSPAEVQSFERRYGLVSYLFPPVPDDGYYLQNLAVLPEARGRGVGEALFRAVAAKATSSGLNTLCLDAAHDIPAVSQYLKWGMRVLVESRVPELDEAHGIVMRYRMVLPLD
jgi:ribosomal protein S18 acetylase RimI-like enzyme